MPTQTVIDKLKDLQVELETVAAAVKHIDDASKVAITASEILKEVPELINHLKDLEERTRQEFLKVYKEKISELESQLKAQIENEKIDRETIKRLINKEVDTYRSVVNPILAELKGKTQQLNKIIEETNNLKITIQNYYDGLKRINFPDRLDKIDNQISAINIGIGNLLTAIQTTQTKVDVAQLALIAINQLIDKKFSDLENRILTENAILKKEVKTNRIIQLIGFGLILIILVYLILKRH